MWSAGGARSMATPAKKPSVAANSGPRTRAAPTTTRSARLGTTPSQAKCGKRLTCNTTANATTHRPTRPRTRLMSVFPVVVGRDDRAVGFGTLRHDHTHQVERREV